ncbi:MAG: hypothetical protein ABEI52_02980 [Halobacteriaceae archaeon]
MDEDTARAIGEIAPAFIPLLQTGINAHFENRQMERTAELELEKAEKQAERMKEMSMLSRNEPGPDTRTREPDRSDIEVINQYMRETDCGLCESLLEEMKDLNPTRRSRALVEFGEFRRSIRDDAPQEEMESVIRESEVLRGILEEELRDASNDT